MKMGNIARTLLVLLVAMLLSCCASNRESSFFVSDEDLIRNLLYSDRSITRQEYFLIREFKPSLKGKWIGQAVSYGCYREGQAPGVEGPTKAEILEDLKIISQHWNLIRVYNADDDTQRILEVIRDNKLPISMMLGVWLENETGRPEARSANIENVLRGIRLANMFKDIVTAVNVGNETQVYWSGHKLAEADLIRYIRALRGETTVPVTTADDYNFWTKVESSALASELDFITVHAYPLWNGLTLDTAFPWLESTLSDVSNVHPGKIIVLGEIGWATEYDPSKKGDGQQGTLIKGEVGYAAQERFLLDLDTWIQTNRIPTFLFEAFDEPWKGGGEASASNEIEKNWGVFRSDRTPKQSFLDYLSRRTTDR
jgi:exo-beta-1,3-glucanase (GH17 family)